MKRVQHTLGTNSSTCTNTCTEWADNPDIQCMYVYLVLV